MVERHLAKVNVASSNLVFRSMVGKHLLMLADFTLYAKEGIALTKLRFSSKTKGIMCIMCSALCFAVMAAFVRLSGDVPSLQKSFFRNAVAMVAAAIVLCGTEEKFHFKKSNLFGLLMRSIFGTTGLLCNFYAIDHMLLSDSTMLNKLSPFFAIIGSFFLLKERMKPFQIIAVITAFVGSLFIIKPSGSGLMSSGAIFGLIGGFGAGTAYTFVRYLSKRGERGQFIVFFFSTFSTLVTLPFLLFDYHPMSGFQLLCLLIAGCAAACAQFAITAAYSYAPAKEISVFDYTQVIFAAVLGFFMFGQVPDIYSVIGYVIIILTSVAMFFYNSKEAEQN